MFTEYRSTLSFARMILAACVLCAFSGVCGDESQGPRSTKGTELAKTSPRKSIQKKSTDEENIDDDDDAEIEELKRKLREAEEKKRIKKAASAKDKKDGIDLNASVLIITSASKTGTGFVGEFKGKYFIVTNVHMVTDDSELTFTTIGGKPLQFSNVGYTGDSRDIFMIQLVSLPAGVVALPMSEDLLEDVNAGDEIMICGNPLGGGVLHNTHGTVMAIGPAVIEIDCPVFRGNSGSPIYHKKSKKVIGVVSHGRMTTGIDAFTRNARQMSGSPIKRATRFFGVRADSVQNWTPISPTQIGVQAKELEAYIRKLQSLNYLKEHEYSKLTDVASYPELEKIVYKYWRSRKGGYTSRETIDKKALRDLFDDISRLMTHEMGRLRGVKVCDYLQSDKAAISEVFAKNRDYYSSLASAAFRQ